MEVDPYAALAAPFVHHYETLRGRVRLALVSEQLDGMLVGSSSVLDVGGGAGHQSLRLARRGHQVTLLDPSLEMLDRARVALASEPREVAERVGLVHGAASEAESLLPGRRFDVVCCHAVLPYVEDAAALLWQVIGMAADGALVSVVFKNRDALAMRAALEGRWGDAVDAFDADADVGGLGASTRAHTLAEVRDALAGSGARIEAWFGIRVFSDHLTGERTDRLEDVLRAERAAASRDPYRRVGRLIHVLARRTG